MDNLELLKLSKSDNNVPIPHVVTIVNAGEFAINKDTKAEELKDLGVPEKGYLTRITKREVEGLAASPMYWVRLTVPGIAVKFGTRTFETEITSSDRKNTFNIFERSHGRLFSRIMDELSKGHFTVLANGDVELTVFAISGNWKTKDLDFQYTPMTRQNDGTMAPLQATYTDPSSKTGYTRAAAKRGDLYVFVLADEHEAVPMSRALLQAQRSQLHTEDSKPEETETDEEAAIRLINESTSLTQDEKDAKIIDLKKRTG